MIMEILNFLEQIGPSIAGLITLGEVITDLIMNHPYFSFLFSMGVIYLFLQHPTRRRY